jgi:hypothetical protein
MESTMTASDYNPNDIEFLLSRDIDGDLPPDEQRRLRERLAESPELRSRNEGLRRVTELVSQWGVEQPQVDWTAHAKLVQAKLTQPADADDLRLDAVLRGWATVRPAIDEAALTAGVMSQIRVRRRSRTLYPLLRIGAPLAAAAVLALSVSTVFWAGPQAAPKVSVVEIAAPSMAGGTRGHAVVSFARDTDVAQPTVEASSIAFLTLGASPASSAEAAPL